jgi:tRNA A-37 threonylcarbamoyl transferase component Bud32
MSTKPQEDREDADKSVPASGPPDPDDARTPEERLRGSPYEDVLRLLGDQALSGLDEGLSSSTREGMVTPRGEDTGTELGAELSTHESMVGPPTGEMESAIVSDMVLSNKYRVIRKLGEGGMASVWLVQHLGLGETRALKIIRSSIAEDPTYRERFDREARILARLKHPNAVIVYDVGVVGDVPCIAMEYLEGRTLRERLASGQPCQLPWVEWVLREVCNVLARAHDLGIVHLDLKPANIVITTDRVSGREQIKVLDFGIAMILGGEPVSSSGPAVRMDRYIGTPLYSSPEQFAIVPGVPIDHRSDLYSLGVMLYEMLTGARPFKGTSTQLSQEHAHKKPPRFAEIAPTIVVPQAVEELVLQCLEKDPNARPKSASKLADMFREAIRHAEAHHNRTGATVRFPAKVVVGVASYLSVKLGPGNGEAPEEEAGERALPGEGEAPGKERGERAFPWDDTNFFVSFMASVPGQGLLPAMVRVRISVAVENFLIGGTAETLQSKESALSAPAASGLVSLPIRFVTWLGRTLKRVAPGSVASTRHGPGILPRDKAEPRQIQEVRGSIGRSTDNAEVLVPLKGHSPEIRFTLRGIGIGPGRVMIDFAQDGRPIGSVDLASEVVASIDPQDSLNLDASASVELLLNLAAGSIPVPPDLVIKVFVHRFASQIGRLQFVVSSPLGELSDLSVMDGDYGTIDLKTDVAGWVEGHLGALAALASQTEATPDMVSRTLARVGHRLFEQLVPSDLQDLYWKIRGRNVKTVLILSDEPHIPWELIKPYRDDPVTGELVEGEFWGESYALTRWLRGRPPARRFAFNRIFALAPGPAVSPIGEAAMTRDMAPQAPLLESQAGLPPGPSAWLPISSDEELAVLRLLEASGSRVQLLRARCYEILNAFEQGDFDLLHLAAHGEFAGSSTADASSVLMEDGAFRAGDLSGTVSTALRRAAPLIFFNSCQSGRLGFSLTRLGSWGAEFVRLGCGGFVGTLWPVTDRAASVFAQAFYRSMFEGRSIGEAMLRARQQVRESHPNDPTWLAYCCFADPLARVELAARKSLEA